MPGDEWKQLHQDGYYMKCLCKGLGAGKWTCDPLPYCKVVEHGKKVFKPDGATWIKENTNQKCSCIRKVTINCISLSAVQPMKVSVNSGIVAIS